MSTSWNEAASLPGSGGVIRDDADCSAPERTEVFFEQHIEAGADGFWRKGN